MDYFIDFANHSDSKVFIPKAGMIPIKRGQHIFGTRKLAEFMGVARSLIRRKLKILEEIGFLTHQTTHRFSIITILNYDLYNPLKSEKSPPINPQATHKRPTSDPQATTPNKFKEFKEFKETTVKASDFEAFWEAYPKKRNKGNAKRVWLDLLRAQTLPSMKKLLKAIERQKGSEAWTKDDGRFIPYPESWLNGECWLDEIGRAGKWVV